MGERAQVVEALEHVDHDVDRRAFGIGLSETRDNPLLDLRPGQRPLRQHHVQNEQPQISMRHRFGRVVGRERPSAPAQELPHVALRELLTGPNASTDSRVSLLTGVHRKEVRRLRTLDEEREEAAPPGLSLVSEVIARWVGTPAYTDSRREPLVLPRFSPEDYELSFEALVASVTTDVRSRAVLEAMLAQDLATRDASGRVRLNVSAFLPRRGQDEQLFYFGRNLHDHIAAATGNVAAGDGPPFFDRSVHYDGLTEAQAAKLEAAGRELGQKLLLELNRLALELLEREEGSAMGPTRRVNLGVYLYSEDEAGRGDG